MGVSFRRTSWGKRTLDCVWRWQTPQRRHQGAIHCNIWPCDPISGWKSDAQAVNNSIGTTGQQTLRRCQIVSVYFVCTGFDVNDQELAIVFKLNLATYQLPLDCFSPRCNLFGRVFGIRDWAISFHLNREETRNLNYTTTAMPSLPVSAAPVSAPVCGSM